MFIYDTADHAALSIGLTDGDTAARLVATPGDGEPRMTIIRMSAADLRGMIEELSAMADEIDLTQIANEIAAADDAGAAEENWPGRRLAAPRSDFWHAARDCAPATLCGLSVATSDLSTRHLAAAQRMCPGCCNAVTAALVATGQLDSEAAVVAITTGPPAARPADYVAIARWGRFMGSLPGYIKGEQAAAHRDRAPLDAIYRSGDPRQGGRWVTAREVSNPLAIATLTDGTS
jgi:hypothetical protein